MNVIDPLLEGVGFVGPAGLLALEEAGGVIVGITAGERQLPADEVLGPARVVRQDQDILCAPDGPCTFPDGGGGDAEGTVSCFER